MVGTRGMGWGWLFFVLLMVGVVVLVVVLIRLLWGGGRDEQRRPPLEGRSRALEVLDERYARGEIDAAEYDERRRRLEGPEG
ncbi:SHOCT domain-containing protein [Georgenia sp. TF02-10]|uniref:SHOCT domain-containing protein n=1 Tax=Georgenia sp. TF02-10 TaxID=2917725 RepID=UPI001FA7FEA7|nr:SHOCT domain-containing protein [Georgenia sp. TF02-10]UNX53324.1 SHOCT domain-containing protein [Georgenia sp. TF02-10]